MPNGGSDCCGTCWFNEKNKGEAGYAFADDRGPDRCNIRDLDIAVPFYTYCANHPQRAPERLTTPVGPVWTGDSCGSREVWKDSPDTEEIRLKLLELLNGIQPFPDTEYPMGARLDAIVVWQLGEFRERRAVAQLERIAAFDPSPSDEFGVKREHLVEIARDALARIAEGPPAR